MGNMMMMMTIILAQIEPCHEHASGATNILTRLAAARQGTICNKLQS
jgi:hypothetical protein